MLKAFSAEYTMERKKWGKTYWALHDNNISNSNDIIYIKKLSFKSIIQRMINTVDNCWHQNNSATHYGWSREDDLVLKLLKKNHEKEM